MNTDITTPGYIRLPVCSGATAMAAWTNPSRVDINDPNYPCVPLQGVTKCDSYHFTDATSDASPYVSDCQEIINNIQGTSGTWSTTLSRTRQIVSAGTCALSVEEDRSESNQSMEGSLSKKTVYGVYIVTIHIAWRILPENTLSSETCADLKFSIQMMITAMLPTRSALRTS